MAQRRLDAGGDLSLDDFATLTRETVVHPAMPMKAFQARLRALIAERDPSGEVVRALDVAAADLASGTSIETLRAEGRALLAKVGQLKEIGDFDSEEAKGLVRQWNARTSNVRRPSEAQRDLIRGAIHDAFAEAQAGPETLPYDLSALEFFREVARRMKARGELSGSG
jgi:hypothetical protein